MAKSRDTMVKPLKGKVGGQPSGIRWADLPWQTLLKIAAILTACAWIYRPVLHGGWLMDDNLYITGNPLLLDPARLWKAWFAPGSFPEYYPIEQSLQWMQWKLWHDDTFGYHVTNLVLHMISALLVWRLLDKLGLRWAWLGGLIFAVHPAMVESVAWIAEFKNALSFPPFLLTMIFYLEYEEKRKSRDYYFALGFFILAMLCKISMASFPLVILLHAWWKTGWIRWNDFKCSIPFFVVSFVLGWLTFSSGWWYAELHQTPPDEIPLGGALSHLALAGLSVSFYFWDSIWPVGLLPIYPQWRVDPPSLLQFLPWPIAIGFLYLFWMKRETWGRSMLFGFGFFVILLAPFLGFNTISYMNFTWVMDHFLYIPIVGLIGLLVAGLGAMSERLPSTLHLYLVGMIGVLMLLLAWESRAYAKEFVSQEVLWTYTLERNPDAWVAHNNLGNVLLHNDRISDAIEQYRVTLGLNPNLAETHFNLGNALLRMGQIAEAHQHYEQAVQLNPNFAEAQQNCGITLIKLGHPDEAIDSFKAALRINPGYVAAQNNWGVALVDLGRAPEAIAHFESALQIKPDYPEAYYNWGLALVQMKQFSDAVQKFKQALQLKPDYPAVREDWGNMLLAQGQFAAALDQFQAVLAFNPDDPVAHFNSANTLLRAGRPAEALSHYQAVQHLSPNFADAYSNMGAALLLLGRKLEAIQQFQEALRLDSGNKAALNNLGKLTATKPIPAHQ